MGEELWHSFAGCRMRYLRLGPMAAAPARHPPLVLIHGLLGYSFSWRHNLEAFARERTVYAVDLPGIGYSDRPAPGTLDLSLPATAGRMLEWLSGLGSSGVDLLGSSHGGALAMMMAALVPQQTQRKRLSGAPPATEPAKQRRNPESEQSWSGSSGLAEGETRARLINRLVLVAPTNPWSRAGRFRLALLRTPLGAWMARRGTRLARARWIALKRLYGDQTKLTRATFDGYSRMADLPGTVDYCLAIVKAWRHDMSELRARLESIELPTLLIWGELDRAVSPVSGRELAGRLRRSELVIMPGTGHLPYEEAPAEFNHLVLNFLDHANKAPAPLPDTLPQ